MKDYLVKVGDQFRIEERLREIDPSYRLFYNKKDKRYEVYSAKNGAISIAFISPYSELDVRLITYARRTRVERMEKLLKEIEEENKQLEQKQEKEKLEAKKMMIKEKLKAVK